MTTSRLRGLVATLAVACLALPLAALTAHAQTGTGSNNGSQGGQGGLFGGTSGSASGGQRGQSGLSQGQDDPANPVTPSGPAPTREGATSYNPCGPDGQQAVDDDGYLVFDDYGDPVCTDGTVVPNPDTAGASAAPVDETYWYEETYVPDEEVVG